MSTRSLTIMVDGDFENEEIAVLYRQMDGYPSGHGKELAEFLAGFETVNGLGFGNNPPKVANGGSCLAAQIVSRFKVGPGGFYLHPAGTRGAGENYRYIVTAATGQEPSIEAQCVTNSDIGLTETLFHGTASAFLAWINTEKTS